MDDEPSSVERVAAEIGAALEPLRAMLASEEALLEFVREELGIDAPDTLEALGIDLGAVDAVIKGLDDLGDALAADEPDRATVALRSAQLAAAVAVIVATWRASGRGPRTASIRRSWRPAVSSSSCRGDSSTGW